MNTAEPYKRELIVSGRQLTKVYGFGKSATHAVNCIDIDLYRGELLVILGTSGSGKSTLLNLIGGMDYADSGSITAFGLDITKMNDKQLTAYRRDKIGFVFQFYDLIMDLTASENIRMAAKLSRVPYDSESVFDAVALQGKENRYPFELSGGEQQRVAIARAIVKGAELILCDEPTGALDSATGQHVIKILANLVRDKGITVVIVTHMMQLAMIADRVIRMNSGKIAEQHINEHPLSVDELEW